MRTLLSAVATLAITGALLFTTAEPASAWAVPDVRLVGGGCTANGSDPAARIPITWIITNHEAAYPGSPLTFINVTIAPASFGAPAFPALANTGEEEAVATTTPPLGYSGPVKLTVTPRFTGTDGNHTLAPISKTVTVSACVTPVTAPTTTTTSTTVPSTTTTSTTFAPPTTVSAVAAAEAVAPSEPAAPVAATPTFTG